MSSENDYPKQLIINIPQLPPAEYSPNARVHWAQRYKVGKAYKKAVYYEAVDARNKADWKALEYAELELEFIVAEERIRDADNWIARQKPGTDALVDAGIILYDDLRHLTCKGIKFTVDKERAPMSVITVKEVE